MAAVQLDAGQKAVLDAIDTALDTIFNNGTEQPPGTPYIKLMSGYDAAKNINGKDIRPDIRNGFRIAFVSLMTGLQAWVAPTLGTGWTNLGAPYDNVGYYKTPTNEVVLRGMVVSAGTTNVVFTLPAGYRPAGRCAFASSSTAGTGRVDVDTDGTVNWVTGGATGFVSLATVRFRAA